MDIKYETFTVYEDDWKHEIGNTDCPECYSWYPLKCKCGGLVHAEFFEEHYDAVILLYKCDKCGDEYEVDDT